MKGIPAAVNERHENEPLIQLELNPLSRPAQGNISFGVPFGLVRGRPML